jgi:hypothetical protein
MPGQVSHFDRYDGTSFMSREQEVLAHMRVVADDLEFVMVEAGGECTDATMSMIPNKTDQLMLHLGGSGFLRSAEPGMVVKVSYTQNQTSYSFLSVVTARAEFGRIEVAVPRLVERRERRASRRINVHAGRRVRIQTDWGGELTVFDLSTSGLGVVVPAVDVRRVQEGGIRGVLTLAEGLRLNVWLDVRHVRELKATGSVLAGARFLGLSARESAILHSYIDTRGDNG